MPVSVNAGRAIVAENIVIEEDLVLPLSERINLEIDAKLEAH